MKFVQRVSALTGAQTKTSIKATYPELFKNDTVDTSVPEILFRADTDVTFFLNDSASPQAGFLLKSGEIYTDSSGGVTDVFITSAGSVNVYFLTKFGGFLRTKEG
jgi:hypothetical protein